PPAPAVGSDSFQSSSSVRRRKNKKWAQGPSIHAPARHHQPPAERLPTKKAACGLSDLRQLKTTMDVLIERPPGCYRGRVFYTGMPAGQTCHRPVDRF